MTTSNKLAPRAGEPSCSLVAQCALRDNILTQNFSLPMLPYHLVGGGFPGISMFSDSSRVLPVTNPAMWLLEIPRGLIQRMLPRCPNPDGYISRGNVNIQILSFGPQQPVHASHMAIMARPPRLISTRSKNGFDWEVARHYSQKVAHALRQSNRSCLPQASRFLFGKLS